MIGRPLSGRPLHGRRLRGRGLSESHPGSVGGSSSGSGLPVPVLTWVSGPEDNTPEFELIVSVGVLLENDDAVLYIDDNSGFSSPDEYSHTVTALEAATGEIAITVSSPLANGLTYARAQGERAGSPVTAFSNTESETIDATMEWAGTGVYVVENGNRSYGLPGAYIAEPV